MHGGLRQEATNSLRIMATRLLKSEVKLVVEPGSETAMTALLQSSEALMGWRGSPGVDYVGIIFEPAIANEAITAPHIRIAPFQKNQYNKLVVGTLKARSLLQEGGAADLDVLNIATGDMFMTLDAGKAGPREIPPLRPNARGYADSRSDATAHCRP